MLKRLIVAAALTLVATAASAQALRPTYQPSQAAGDLSLGLGSLNVTSTNLTLFSSAGRANIAVGGNWNVEAEANAKAYVVGGVTALPLFLDGYIHVWNGMGKMAWGAFGGSSYQLGIQVNSFGGEFKAFMGNLSFGGAAAMTSFAGTSGWTFNAFANAYVTPNDRIGGHAVWMQIAGGDIWEVSVDAEHRFAQPASFWVSASTLGNSGGTSTMYSIMGGFRFYLDAPGSTQQTHEAQVPFNFRLPLMLGVP